MNLCYTKSSKANPASLICTGMANKAITLQWSWSCRGRACIISSNFAISILASKRFSGFQFKWLRGWKRCTEQIIFIGMSSQKTSLSAKTRSMIWSTSSTSASQKGLWIRKLGSISRLNNGSVRQAPSAIAVSVPTSPMSRVGETIWSQLLTLFCIFWKEDTCPGWKSMNTQYKNKLKWKRPLIMLSYWRTTRHASWTSWTMSKISSSHRNLITNTCARCLSLRLLIATWTFATIVSNGSKSRRESSWKNLRKKKNRE